MATVNPDTAVGSTAELPDVLQFMQLLWAVVHGVERTSKRMSASWSSSSVQILTPLDATATSFTTAGFIPTGYYPTALALSSDGKRLYVANGKGGGSKANRHGPTPFRSSPGLPPRVPDECCVHPRSSKTW